MQIIQNIQNRIYEIRGERVMPDFDIAALYETGTKVLNQAIKRNSVRFPEDFMFCLTLEEWQEVCTQPHITDHRIVPMRSQIVTASVRSPYKRNIRSIPYAFTEQGIAMLSGVLHSDNAIRMNIAIMRAFVEIRKIITRQTDVKKQLEEIKQRMSEHDVQLSQIYDAIENMLDEKTAKKTWQDRERIGFRK